MTRQSAVCLPNESFERPKSRAERAGRAATYYVRETVGEHLVDLEDLYAAEQTSIGHRKSGGRTLCLEEPDVEPDPEIRVFQEVSKADQGAGNL